MNRLIALAFAVIATTAFANPMTSDEKFNREVGGWLIKPNTQKGVITCVNCQTAAKANWLQEGIDYLRDECTLNVQLATGKFDIKAPTVVGNLSLFVVDDQSLPMSLVAPEARWALVNVAQLKSEKEPFFRARVKKELLRVFGMFCGGFMSSFADNLTEPITRAEDLDTYVKVFLPMDVRTRFKKHLPAFGVEPGFFTTYENACLQGWAPAPTNAVQKAIWDKVHSIPEKPMKITFDPAAQKGKVTK